MKPALIAMAVSTALVILGWMGYSISVSKHAAELGLQTTAPSK